jgi:hypothetical protein
LTARTKPRQVRVERLRVVSDFDPHYQQLLFSTKEFTDGVFLGAPFQEKM